MSTLKPPPSLPTIPPSTLEEILRELKPFCLQLEVVGKSRTHFSSACKLEIAYVPRLETRRSGPFGFRNVNMADEKLNDMLQHGLLNKRPNAQGLFAWGDKNKLAVYAPTNTSVDFLNRTEREMEELLK